MKLHNIDDFIRGWFIGNFEPSLFKTENFEIAIKKYKAGDQETSHVHKIATEYTVIISGMVVMNKIEYSDNDIIVIEPGEYTDFRAITDVVSVVVKTPFVRGDKYE